MATVYDILAHAAVTLTFAVPGVSLIALGSRVQHKASEAAYNFKPSSYNEMVDFEAWNDWKYRMGWLANAVGCFMSLSALIGLAGLIKAIQAL